MPVRKDSDPKNRAWPVFLATHSRLTERIEDALARAKLPPLAWYDVLWELEKAPDQRLRMHQLAERIVLSRSHLTRLADRLEAAGLLRREPCPDDRRGSFCVITQAGLETRATMWPVYGEQIESLFTRHLNAAEAKVLVQAMTRMLQAL